MKLQSELIKEKKLLDNRVDNNIVQKLHLEKRKMILVPTVEVPLTSSSQPASPENSVTMSPCIIKKVKRSLSAEFAKGTLKVTKQSIQGEVLEEFAKGMSKVTNQLIQGEVPDNDLLQAL